MFVTTIWFSVLNPAVLAAVTSNIQRGIVAVRGYNAVGVSVTTWLAVYVLLRVASKNPIETVLAVEGVPVLFVKYKLKPDKFNTKILVVVGGPLAKNEANIPEGINGNVA